jgi:hypothetical protein
MNSFHILYNPEKNVGVSINKPEFSPRQSYHDPSPYDVIYDAWEKFLGFPEGEWHYSNCIHIWSPYITPQGVPYDYDLCPDGGLYSLFDLGYPSEAIKQAKDYLYYTADVVQMGVVEVKLIDWTPPAPFEQIQLPGWVRKPGVHHE